MLAAALEELAALGTVTARSQVVDSAPVGPSQRTYANAAALLESDCEPDSLLDGLQGLESAFGRRRHGQRWSARVLDLDIVLWSGGTWASERLTIPHPHFRARAFVSGPAAAIAPLWRDPLTGLTMRQLDARLTRSGPLPKRVPGGRALSSVGRATDF